MLSEGSCEVGGRFGVVAIAEDGIRRKKYGRLSEKKESSEKES